MSHSTMLTTRRSFLRSGLMTLAALSPLAARLPDAANAKKNGGRKPTSIAKRVTDEKRRCQEGGGTLWTTYRPGSATSTCTGGTRDGRECDHTRQSSVCTQAAGPAPSGGDGPFASPLDGTSHPLHPDRPTADPGDLPGVPLEQHSVG